MKRLQPPLREILVVIAAVQVGVCPSVPNGFFFVHREVNIASMLQSWFFRAKRNLVRDR